MILATQANSNAIAKSIMNIASEMVACTYGPNGGFVVLSDGNTTYTTKDGVSVMMSLSADDPFESAMLDIIREAARNTMSKAGDGTTTTIILANEILKEFDESDYMQKDNIIEKAKENIRAKSTPVSISDRDMLERVALTSTAGDKELSMAVVDAFELANKYGVNGIYADISLFSKTKVEEIDGVSFIGNIAHRSFFRDTGKLTREEDNCAVIISIDEVYGEEEIVEMITKMLDKDIKSVVVIAPSFADNALSAMMLNDGMSINIVPIVISGSPSEQELAIEAISAAIGVDIIGEKAGTLIGDIDDSQFKIVKKFSINGTSVTIVDEGDVSERAQELIDRYTSNLRVAQSDAERDMYKILISILSKKIIKIVVHADSSSSAKERKDRADDCINAIELALEDGVVQGAGRIYQEMWKGQDTKTSLKKAADRIISMLPIGDFVPLDPTRVAEIVAEQSIDLAFMLGKIKSISIKKG